MTSEEIQDLKNKLVTSNGDTSTPWTRQCALAMWEIAKQFALMNEGNGKVDE